MKMRITRVNSESEKSSNSEYWCFSSHLIRVVVVMIVWQLDLQLPMQSVPITTDVVSSNLEQGKLYNIM
jgi:hypothetical protein